jgi:hypothetical protein
VLFDMIMKGKFEFDERYWSDKSAEAKDLIRRILVVKPDQRFTTQQVPACTQLALFVLILSCQSCSPFQILTHPWITGQESLPRVNLSKSISMNLKKKSTTAVASTAAALDESPVASPQPQRAAAAAATAGPVAAVASCKLCINFTTGTSLPHVFACHSLTSPGVASDGAGVACLDLSVSPTSRRHLLVKPRFADSTSFWFCFVFLSYCIRANPKQWQSGHG